MNESNVTPKRLMHVESHAGVGSSRYIALPKYGRGIYTGFCRSQAVASSGQREEKGNKGKGGGPVKFPGPEPLRPTMASRTSARTTLQRPAPAFAPHGDCLSSQRRVALPPRRRTRQPASLLQPEPVTQYYHATSIHFRSVRLGFRSPRRQSHQSPGTTSRSRCVLQTRDKWAAR